MAEGVGVDLIEISRLERALERHPRLAERLFTERELEHARRHVRPGRRLAARFAVKEAAVKALGLTGGFGLREIEVTGDRPPQVRLSGGAGEAARRKRVVLRVSLTHAREIAAAVAVASAHPGSASVREGDAEGDDRQGPEEDRGVERS